MGSGVASAATESALIGESLRAPPLGSSTPAPVVSLHRRALTSRPQALILPLTQALISRTQAPTWCPQALISSPPSYPPPPHFALGPSSQWLGGWQVGPRGRRLGGALPRGEGQTVTPTEEREGTEFFQFQVSVASSLPREGHDSAVGVGVYGVENGRENGLPTTPGQVSQVL